ncbi:MAG: isochorismatase family cysteine hydrolase [Thermodesulfobacteriota bacterium]
MEPENSKSGLILVEFQNQWTEPGLYHFLIRRQLQSRGVIQKTRRLVKESRDLGIKIVHAPLVIDPQNKRGLLAHLTFGQVFTLGSRRSEITSGIYEEGDLVVKGRYAFDAFIGSNLEDLLRNNGMRRVFLAGFTTDQCVAKTLRTALRKGFQAYLISDCTATMSRFLQKKTERKFGECALGIEDLLDLITPRGVSASANDDRVPLCNQL